MEQLDAQTRRLEAFHFQEYKPLVVRLEAESQIPSGALVSILREHGEETTQIGRFTWTRFDNWAEALNFYFQYHKHWIDARNLRNQLCATPISMSGAQFQDTMAGYVYEALGPKAQARVRELPADGRPGLHHKLTSWS